MILVQYKKDETTHQTGHSSTAIHPITRQEEAYWNCRDESSPYSNAVRRKQYLFCINHVKKEAVVLQSCTTEMKMIEAVTEK